MKKQRNGSPTGSYSISGWVGGLSALSLLGVHIIDPNLDSFTLIFTASVSMIRWGEANRRHKIKDRARGGRVLRVENKVFSGKIPVKLPGKTITKRRRRWRTLGGYVSRGIKLMMLMMRRRTRNRIAMSIELFNILDGTRELKTRMQSNGDNRENGTSPIFFCHCATQWSVVAE